MANKKMAVFLMCVVVVAALQLSTADRSAEMEAKFKAFFGDLSSVEAKFKSCCETCEKECTGKGSDYSSCHSKCDAYCGKKEVADKLNINLPINN